MRSRRTTAGPWRFLVLAGLFLQAPLVAGQERPFLPQPHLAADVRCRLADAARDPSLAPWQREFMLGVARHGTEGTATPLLPALPGVALPSARTVADDGAWIAIPPPSGLSGHTAIYDPVRDRMVVFGGYGGDSYSHLWALSLGSPAWSALAPAGSPPPGRYDHTAIYDPVRDRMVVFGGYDGISHHNDVWALALSGSPAWGQLSPAGSPPPGRRGHTAIYDPARDRMLVFGGVDFIGYRNDVWALSLAGSPAWNALASAGTPPTPRYRPTAIYDPVRDRMVVFGGSDGSSYPDNVWALSLAESPAWSALAPAGTPPSARFGHTAIYDPARGRMLVFGGVDFIGYRNDVWALSLAGSPAWDELTPAGSPPPGRERHTAIYDPVRDRMVVFGGVGAIPNDVWAHSLSGSPAWSVLAPAGSRPSERVGHTAIYDPVRDRMVVFGGFDDSNRNDVWALSLSGSPEWTQLTPTGTPPGGRSLHTAIYDPVRDRMLVLGGTNGPSIYNDVSALSLAGSPAWSALAPTGSPPFMPADVTAIYDPVHDRMVVCGIAGDTTRNDVWAMTLSGSPAWSQLSPAGSPLSVRFGHTAIYDPVRDRMVVFGGRTPGGAYYNDVWALSLAGSPAWGQLSPAGSPPLPRRAHTAIYDPVRDRMVVLGGNCPCPNDPWALSLAGSPAWSQLSPAGNPPSGRYGHTAIYDPVHDRMVVFGGIDGIYRNDVWALGWTSPVSVPGDANAHPRRLELAPLRPNPSRGETTVDFELGEPARVVLDVFDAHGRRVKRIVDGWVPAGRHQSTWRGDDDRGHALGSGVYFFRMQASGFQATRRTVLVR